MYLNDHEILSQLIIHQYKIFNQFLLKLLAPNDAIIHQQFIFKFILQLTDEKIKAVSYTHLTLPTKA